MQRAALLVAALVLLSGCSSLLGPRETTRDPFDAPTVDVDETSTAVDSAAVSPGETTPSSTNDPDWAGLRPTCERPPSLVVTIQLQAIRHNDPTTDEGMLTAYTFSSPANQRFVGGFDDFVGLFRTDTYRPMTTFERVAYGPVERANGSASLRVTLAGPNGTHAYEYDLQQVDGGQHEGCWMVDSVRDVDREEGPTVDPTGGVVNGSGRSP